jgi:SAM-dependent methyltransferase
VSTTAKLPTRDKSYGHDHPKTVADRFGYWLSTQQIRRAIPSFAGKAIGDFGCGYRAEFVRPHLFEVGHATLVDVTLADDLKADPHVTAIEGTLPDALAPVPSGSLDVVLCNNVLEHLAEPRVALEHFRRIVKPGGVCYFNVPSWRGKFFLELIAFKLHMTSPIEIDEHKNYFEKEDLWRLLVSAGFKPSEIACHKHKFGLNTFAVCRVKL